MHIWINEQPKKINSDFLLFLITIPTLDTQQKITVLEYYINIYTEIRNMHISYIHMYICAPQCMYNTYKQWWYLSFNSVKYIVILKNNLWPSEDLSAYHIKAMLLPRTMKMFSLYFSFLLIKLFCILSHGLPREIQFVYKCYEIKCIGYFDDLSWTSIKSFDALHFVQVSHYLCKQKMLYYSISSSDSFRNILCNIT
jgi:hypothetical protein